MDIEQKGRRIEFEILGKRLNEIYVKTIEQTQRAQSKFLFTTNGSENKCSFDNLLCYLALTEHDLSDLQLSLDDEGLSSLGMLEGHVLWSKDKDWSYGAESTSTKNLCSQSAAWKLCAFFRGIPRYETQHIEGFSNRIFSSCARKRDSQIAYQRPQDKECINET